MSRSMIETLRGLVRFYARTSFVLALSAIVAMGLLVGWALGQVYPLPSREMPRSKPVVPIIRVRPILLPAVTEEAPAAKFEPLALILPIKPEFAAGFAAPPAPIKPIAAPKSRAAAHKKEAHLARRAPVRASMFDGSARF